MFGRIAAGVFGGFLIAQLGATALFAAFSLSNQLDFVTGLIHPSATATFVWILLAVFIWFVGPLVALNAPSSWQAWRQLCIVAALLALALAVLAFLSAGEDTRLSHIQAAYADIGARFDKTNPGAILHALPEIGRQKLLCASIPVCLVVSGFLLIAGLLSGRDPAAR